MKKLIVLFCVAFSFVCAGFSQAEWVPLFNGKNLKGWKKLNGTAEYLVEDGAIVGISKRNSPNTFLATEKSYGDFILEFEFKIDDVLNSGVQFRSNSLKEYNNGRVHGYQFEIDPSKRAWTGGIYDEARRGWLYALAGYPEAQKAFRNGEWNKARVEAIGSRIRTWVNGIACADVLDDMTASGFVALQVHAINDASQEGKTIAWRNINICTKGLEAVKAGDNRETTQANCIANTISEREAAEGWKLLWDGKTTHGWRGARMNDFPAKGWAIDNGVLKVLKSDGSESTNGGDIVTQKKYKNFILSVDFKITPGANSGIKYFVDTETNKQQGSSIGCEFQLLDDKKHPDAKLGVDGNRTLGSLYDLIKAPEDKPYRNNFFNNARIVVQDSHVEHWLNNIKIVEYERGTQMWRALVAYSKFAQWPFFGEAREGCVLLQDHGDEVWFQNIKIKELP